MPFNYGGIQTCKNNTSNLHTLILTDKIPRTKYQIRTDVMSNISNQIDFYRSKGNECGAQTPTRFSIRSQIP